MNVLPLVNKGLALYQWKQDIGAAERCCDEALRIDPECEAAVATLAQLSLQQSKIERAVEMFTKQTDLSRSEPELVNALTYQFVSLLILSCDSSAHGGIRRQPHRWNLSKIIRSKQTS